MQSGNHGGLATQDYSMATLRLFFKYSTMIPLLFFDAVLRMPLTILTNVQVLFNESADIL